MLLAKTSLARDSSSAKQRSPGKSYHATESQQVAGPLKQSDVEKHSQRLYRGAKDRTDIKHNATLQIAETASFRTRTSLNVAFPDPALPAFSFKQNPVRTR
jgi:hypothetical protein